MCIKITENVLEPYSPRPVWRISAVRFDSFQCLHAPTYIHVYVLLCLSIHTNYAKPLNVPNEAINAWCCIKYEKLFTLFSIISLHFYPLLPQESRFEKDYILDQLCAQFLLQLIMILQAWTSGKVIHSFTVANNFSSFCFDFFYFFLSAWNLGRSSGRKL